MLHIAEIDWKRFEQSEETVQTEGDKIDVKLNDIYPKTGKLKLSQNALRSKPEGVENGNGKGEGRGKRERRPHNNPKE